LKKIQFLFVGCLLYLTSHGQDLEGLKKINGTLLNFHTLGKGEPLLVIHGGPALSYTYFLPHLGELSKKYKLIFYDQRANGKSAVPKPDSLGLKFFVDDIEAIRKELAVEKISVLGHSWGALVAVNYGIHYPGRIKRLILCNPVPMSSEYDGEELKNQQKKAASRDSTDRSIILGSKGFKNEDPEAFRKLIILSFRHSFYDESNLKKLVIHVNANYVESSRALAEGLGKDLDQYNFFEGLKGMSVPTLIIHGADDAIPLTATSRLQKAIVGSKLEVYKKCGHFAFIEKHEKFTSDVVSFLRNK
jgi:proline iminopeptidase